MTKKELINLINTVEEDFRNFGLYEINRKDFADSETYWKVRKAWTLYDIKFKYFQCNKNLNKFKKEILESYLDEIRIRLIDLKGFINNL